MNILRWLFGEVICTPFLLAICTLFLRANPDAKIIWAIKYMDIYCTKK